MRKLQLYEMKHSAGTSSSVRSDDDQPHSSFLSRTGRHEAAAFIPTKEEASKRSLSHHQQKSAITRQKPSTKLVKTIEPLDF
jgi:hypothetical protein